jgi:NADPH:quinone reductase-like Zn-dependent oxidoreductase
MKAAVRKKYGSPEVLQVVEFDKPIPSDNEILVKVYATTVNRTDCGILFGKPFFIRFFSGLTKPRLPIPGTDFAGEIEAVGDRVTKFKVGDRVWGFDDNGVSSNAEFLVINEDKPIAIVPATFSYSQAVASPEGAHYALNFINKVDLTRRQKVLVNGATGAIGSAAIQFLKYYDAHVTAVCNTKNMELVKSLGADRVIDYTQEDFTLLPEKYDFIFDAVGKSSFGKCKSILHSRGIYISSELGYGGQNLFYALLTPIFSRKKVIFPLPTNIKASMLFIQKRIDEGKFKPVIDRTYSLENISEAYSYVASGHKVGNVILQIHKAQ